MRRSHRVGGHTVKVAYVPRDQKGFEGDAGGRPDFRGAVRRRTPP